MLRAKRIAFLWLLVVALLLSACRAVQRPETGGTLPQGAGLDAATSAGVDAIVQRTLDRYPAPGMALCVVRGDRLVYGRGFGLADIASGRPWTLQSVQIQASVTKPLTAMAVLRLAEQGLVDLDASVIRYLPWFQMADERYRDITLRMLLSHRAGLPDAPHEWPDALDPAANPLVQAAGYLRDKSLLFAPGTGWNYTNYGYILLGAVIEAVTGQRFEQHMREQWLEPLGMSHATFDAGEVDPDRRVTLYSGVRGSIAPAMLLCDSRDAPACNLWSSCEEMAKLAELLLNRGELAGRRYLQPGSIEAMWQPLSPTQERLQLGPRYGAPADAYGLGWFAGTIGSHRVAGHTGAIPGANTQLLLAPDDGLAVIAMDNWLGGGPFTGYPAALSAYDVMYLLLSVEP